MRIQTNTAANSAYQNLANTSMATEKSIQRLSSGFRINKASDDASGLAIANSLRANTKSLQAAQRNATQASSILQIADGATQTVQTILNRMKELATQANSSANDTNAFTSLNSEFTALKSEIDRIVNTTSYQGTKLIDGNFGGAAGASVKGTSSAYVAGVANISIDPTFNTTVQGTSLDITAGGTNITVASATSTDQQTIADIAGAGVLNFDKMGVVIETNAAYTKGALDATTIDLNAASGTGATFQVSSSGNYNNSTKGDLVAVTLKGLDTTTLGVNGSTLTSQTNAQTALTAIDAAIVKVGTQIGAIGAAQNRFDFATQNTATLVQNVQAAESVIRDADMAYEMTQFTKNQVLQQAGTAMLAQANQLSQGVLTLLRG